MTRLASFSALAVLAITMFVSGCTTPATDGPSQSQQAVASNAQADSDHEGRNQSASAEVEQALAGLSAEDRALAEAQKTCPVSDKPLGAMGTPKKLEVGGRTVFICCDGCADALRDDPDKYLAKLNP